MGFFKFLGRKKEKTEVPISGLEVPLPPPSLRGSSFSSELPSFPGPPLKEEILPAFEKPEKPLFESEVPMPPRPAPTPPKPEFFKHAPPKPMFQDQKAPVQPKMPPMPELKPLEVPSFDLSKFEGEIGAEEKPLFEKPSFGEKPLFEIMAREKPLEEKPFVRPLFGQREIKASLKHESFVEVENFKLIMANLNRLQSVMQDSESFERAIDSKERAWKALRNDLEEVQKEILHFEKSIFES